MAVHGFVTQARANRRNALLFAALYIVPFFVLTLLILSELPLYLGDADRSLFVDPLAYAADWWAFGLLIPAAILLWTTYTFDREITEVLKVKPVVPSAERRFASIAAEQATLQGLKAPRLGIIEVAACNAVTVGTLAGPPTIAVTRGLLQSLDDDELAAVLAHEIAHWRVGDVRLIHFNHLLMRTAMTVQANNPFRIEEDPRFPIPFYLFVFAIMPLALLFLFAAGMVTMAMWRLARFANGKVRTGRDLLADAEAVRMTHFPEALESAIAKCHGHGWFEGAERVEAMLFDGATVKQGGTHPEPEERWANLRMLGGEVYAPARIRRDTRTGAAIPSRQFAPASASASPGQFGRKGLALATAGTAPAGGSGFGAANAARPEFENWTMKRGMTFWTDPESHRQWRRGMLDFFTWRAADRRDIFGITPRMQPWAYGALALAFIAPIAFVADWDGYVAHVTSERFWSAFDKALSEPFSHRSSS